MIKIENTDVVGWEHAIRGMRNPKNSWDRMDSDFSIGVEEDFGLIYHNNHIGPNDHKLMMQLASGGPVHAKYRRMITVYVDVTAPLYWWKEFDTYKVGTVANSCSTMHKIHDKEFTLDDFSCEHLFIQNAYELYTSNMEPIGYKFSSKDLLQLICNVLNSARRSFLNEKDQDIKKLHWWQMIQLLPSSYNQKRTLMLNYEVLHNIYISRKDHKLDEWREFCKWIDSLPHSEIITGKEIKED